MSAGPIKRMTGLNRQGGRWGGTRAVASAAMRNQPHTYFSNVRGWHNRSLLSEVIVGDLDQGRTGAFKSIHAYHVMYNLEIQGLNPGSGSQIA